MSVESSGCPPSLSAGAQQPPIDGPAVEVPPPLTMTKLFTVAGDDGAWTEIGIGVASVSIDDASSNVLEHTARLSIIAIDGTDETLLSTPIVDDDIYVVQRQAIIVWTDPELGREVACSFNTVDGCKVIVDAIQSFQRRVRRTRTPLVSSDGSVVGSPADQQQSANPSSGSSPLNKENSSDALLSPWAVRRENLPALVLALRDNQKRFGMHLRETKTFVSELYSLFSFCQTDGDTLGMDHIGKIVVSLLAPPFNTDGAIMTQFIAEEMIDNVIDMVQWAIGRRSDETGFLSKAKRKATFRDPLQLPEPLCKRIHLLYSATFLKDLVPLSLEEGDAMTGSMLSVLLLRFKFAILADICKSTVIIPKLVEADIFHQQQRQQQQQPAAVDDERGILCLSFLHDVIRSIKNALIPMEPKEDLLVSCVEAGIFTFVADALWHSLDPYLQGLELHLLAAADDEVVLDGGANSSLLKCCQTRQKDEEVFMMGCDVVSFVLMFAPFVRQEMLRDAKAKPSRCLLRALVLTLVVAQTRPASQAASDAIISAGIGLIQSNVPLFQNAKVIPLRRHLLRMLCDSLPPPPAATSITSSSWIEQASLVAVLLAGASAKTLGTSTDGRRSEHHRAVYCLRVLAALVTDPTFSAHTNFASGLKSSNALRSLARIVEASGRIAPSSSSSELLPASYAFIAALIESNEPLVLQQLVDLGVIRAVVQQHVFSTANRRSVSLVNGACSHCVHVMHDSVHKKKSLLAQQQQSLKLGGSRTRSLLTGQPATGDDGVGGAGASSPFPFITELNDSAGAASPSSSGGAAPAVVCQVVVQHVLSLFRAGGLTLGPLLVAKFERAAHETLQEADEDVQSSDASRANSKANLMTDAEFNAMLRDFGPDAPSPEPVTAKELHDAEGLLSLTAAAEAAPDAADEPFTLVRSKSLRKRLFNSTLPAVDDDPLSENSNSAKSAPISPQVDPGKDRDTVEDEEDSSGAVSSLRGATTGPSVSDGDAHVDAAPQADDLSMTEEPALKKQRTQRTMNAAS